MNKLTLITRRLARVPHVTSANAPRKQGVPVARVHGNEIPIALPVQKYTFDTYEVFGLSEQLEPSITPPNNDLGEFALVSMQIPPFFEYNSNRNIFGLEISGLFLVKVMGGLQGIYDKDDKKLGQYGCPQRLDIGIREAFTFNEMEFFPFVMRDLSVGYFVCDGGSTRYSWRGNPRFDVSLDAPLIYDATLGLYVCRSAHLE